MFKLENTKKLKNTLLSISLASFLATTAMAASKETSVDGAVKYPLKDGKYSFSIKFFLHLRNSQ